MMNHPNFGSFSGGGFIQDTNTEMDLSFSGAGNVTSESGSRRSDRLVSVTCIMVHKASLSKNKLDGDFIINKSPVHQVKLVGKVVAVTESQTNCSYMIDDGSGALLEVKRWITDGEHSFEQDIRASIREGIYCSIFGNLRSFSDTATIVSLKILPIATQNEVTRHMIEVVYQHLSMTKAFIPNHTSSDVSSTRSYMSSQPYGLVHINSGLNEIQKGAYSVIRSHLDETGPSILDIVRSLSDRFSEQQVRDAVGFLCSEGHTYSTIDDDHYKSTE